MIGHCINCDKEILRKVNGKWEDVEYHSICFKKNDGNYHRLAFCKKCHDQWENDYNPVLTEKIDKHIEECIREEMKPFIGLEMVEIVSKEGPLCNEDRKNIQVVDAGGVNE